MGWNMNIYKCDKNGICEFLNVEDVQAYGSQAYKIEEDGATIYLPHVPKTFNYGDDVTVYSNTKEDAKDIYVKSILEKIDFT